MFRTKAAAEKAAREGRGQDLDTQQCLALQGQILSSSPPHIEQDASNNEIEVIEGPARSHLSEEWNPDPRRDGEFEAPFLRESEPSAIETQNLGGDPPESTTAGTKHGTSLFKRHLTRILRDHNGNLRKFDSDGNQLGTPECERKPANMEDDLTQNSLSAMSPTQENSQSAYRQFDVQREVPGDDYVTGGSDQVDENTGMQGPQLARQHHSAITDSTAHTYEENDTGHVGFDLLQVNDDNPDPDDENISQDASFAPPLPQEDHSYPQLHDPQTPAPPINPFTYRGSVMKGHEMFGATQPSSIGRHMASATSSRPSPDVYNDFTSPVKQMQSSPLPGRLDANETSPLQSSVRQVLRSRLNDFPLQSIPRTSGVHSFDSGPRIQPQNTVREARPYISVYESQEQRRRKEKSPESGSETENSDDDAPRKRFLKKQREELIQKQLSGVAIYKRASSTIPASSSPGLVEVPSTGRRARRRSTQEDYVAQCDGRDARDTQPDDVIADSQAVPREKEPVERSTIKPNGLSPPWPESMGTDNTNKPFSPNLPAYHTAEHHTPGLDQSSTTDDISSPPKDPGSPLQQPSLPLQEVSTNRSDLRTPMASKLYSDAAYTTVPETSPAEDRIRPMGEIASISFSNETQHNLSDLPGFSQRDFDFEEALRIGEDSSSDPNPRKTEVPGNPSFPVSEQAAGLVEALGESSKRTTPPKPPLEVTEPPVVQTSAEEAASFLDGNEVNEATHQNAIDGEDETQDNTHVENAEINMEGSESSDVAVDENSIKAGPQLLPTALEATSKSAGLRSKDELKGPSKDLRRAATIKPLITYATPRHSARFTKSSSTANPSTSSSSKRASIPKLMSTPLSSLATRSSPSLKSSPIKPARRSARKSHPTKEETPIQSSTKPAPTRRSGANVKNTSFPTPVAAPTRSSKKRKSAAETEQAVVGPVQPTRSSKRQSMPKTSRDSSADPLVGSGPLTTDGPQANESGGLFANMAFAVSYVNQDEEKNKVIRLIKDQGGQILADGFDSLFDLKRAHIVDGDGQLTLSPAATRVGFAALIADEHSRRAKYMQALALGLPCISGRWVISCLSKGEVVDWAPYLLCAGQSTFLGNALRSRTLQPYEATDANFSDTFANRGKILDGRSVLLVEGKGRAAEEKRKAYTFLAQAVGPARFAKVADLEQARAKLLESEKDGHVWDLLYVDYNEAAANSIVFGTTSASSGPKKRKRGPVTADKTGTPAPKKIRIISDETVIQSLILGQLLEE